MKVLTLKLMVVFLLILSLGCSQDVDDDFNHLGKWIEESPAESRTEIFFLSSRTAILSKAGGGIEEMFYHVEKDSIFFMPKDGTGEEQPFFFKMINGRTLQIENIYSSTEETEPSFIIFKRDLSK